jgi:hypothetical protein
LTFRVDEVESIGLADATWVFAASWDSDLAGSGLKIEVLVSGASSLRVCSIVTLVVFLAEVVLQVESSLASASGLCDHGVGQSGVFSVQTGTDRFHAQTHSFLVAGLDPAHKVRSRESLASLAVVSGVVLG